MVKVEEKDCKLAAAIATYRDLDRKQTDAYFSADIETDGSIPGPFSMLSFALVYAGSFDGREFDPPKRLDRVFYREVKPISETFDPEALQINGLDRSRIMQEGLSPAIAMAEAARWIEEVADGRKPVLVAYPLSFDWSWLFWYFTKFNPEGSPFNHSQCFDIKTAVAVKTGVPIAMASRSKLPSRFRGQTQHTHHAIDDAIEQAEIFAKVFSWEGGVEGVS